MNKLGGIICPVTTPFADGEVLDEAALRRQLGRLRGNVDGVLVLGTTGEAAALSTRTAQHCVEVAVDELQGAATIVVGAGDTGTRRTLDNLARIIDGVGFVAVCSPYYYPSAPNELDGHYRRIADRSPVPVVLYNIPQNTHLSLPLDIVARLAEHGNVVGIKDSSGDLTYFRELLRLSSPNFAVLQGTVEDRAAEIFRLGADGYVSGLENIAPGTLVALREAVARGDTGAAEMLQARLTRVLAILSNGFWLACIKESVALLAGGSGHPARPLEPLSPQGLAGVRAALAELGLLAPSAA